MTTPPDDLEQKIDLVLENIELKKREQALTQGNQLWESKVKGLLSEKRLQLARNRRKEEKWLIGGILLGAAIFSLGVFPNVYRYLTTPDTSEPEAASVVAEQEEVTVVAEPGKVTAKRPPGPPALERLLTTKFESPFYLRIEMEGGLPVTYIMDLGTESIHRLADTEPTHSIAPFSLETTQQRYRSRFINMGSQTPFLVDGTGLKVDTGKGNIDEFSLPYLKLKKSGRSPSGISFLVETVLPRTDWILRWLESDVIDPAKCGLKEESAEFEINQNKGTRSLVAEIILEHLAGVSIPGMKIQPNPAVSSEYREATYKNITIDAVNTHGSDRQFVSNFIHHCIIKTQPNLISDQYVRRLVQQGIFERLQQGKFPLRVANPQFPDIDLIYPPVSGVYGLPYHEPILGTGCGLAPFLVFSDDNWLMRFGYMCGNGKIAIKNVFHYGGYKKYRDREGDSDVITDLVSAENFLFATVFGDSIYLIPNKDHPQIRGNPALPLK